MFRQLLYLSKVAVFIAESVIWQSSLVVLSIYLIITWLQIRLSVFL